MLQRNDIGKNALGRIVRITMNTLLVCNRAADRQVKEYDIIPMREAYD